MFLQIVYSREFSLFFLVFYHLLIVNLYLIYLFHILYIFLIFLHLQFLGLFQLLFLHHLIFQNYFQFLVIYFLYILDIKLMVFHLRNILLLLYIFPYVLYFLFHLLLLQHIFLAFHFYLQKSKNHSKSIFACKMECVYIFLALPILNSLPFYFIYLVIHLLFLIMQSAYGSFQIYLLYFPINLLNQLKMHLDVLILCLLLFLNFLVIH